MGKRNLLRKNVILSNFLELLINQSFWIYLREFSLFEEKETSLKSSLTLSLATRIFDKLEVR